MSKITPRYYILLGLVSSLGYILLSDALLVKDILKIPDPASWVIFYVLLLPLLFIGLYSRKVSTIYDVIFSIFYTLIVSLFWTFLCVFILLHFHFLIGGTE